MSETRHPVFASALKLLSGTGAAQLIVLAAMPVLTRLYTQADFGGFGVFLALSTLSAALVTGRYEGAIPLPAEDSKAWGLFKLTLVLSFGGAVLVAGAAALLRFSPATLPAAALSLTDTFVLLIPGVFFVAATTASELWLNRKGLYARVAWHRMIGAGVLAFVQLVGGFVGTGKWGLIGGFLLGTGTTVVLNARLARKQRPEVPGSLRDLAYEYRRFPAYLLAAQVCNSAANHLPTVFIGTFFGNAFAGIYTIANRALAVLDLLVTSVGQVFYQAAAHLFHQGEDCAPLYRQTLGRLFLGAMVVFPIVYLVAPSFFAILFGEEWRESGKVVRYLIPLFFFRFVTVPSNAFFSIAHKQHWYLYRQAAQLVFVCLAFYVGYRTGSFYTAVLYYSLVMAFFYILDALFAFRVVLTPPARTSATYA